MSLVKLITVCLKGAFSGNPSRCNCKSRAPSGWMLGVLAQTETGDCGHKASNLCLFSFAPEDDSATALQALKRAQEVPGQACTWTDRLLHQREHSSCSEDSQQHPGSSTGWWFALGWKPQGESPARPNGVRRAWARLLLPGKQRAHSPAALAFLPLPPAPPPMPLLSSLNSVFSLIHIQFLFRLETLILKKYTPLCTRMFLPLLPQDIYKTWRTHTPRCTLIISIISCGPPLILWLTYTVTPFVQMRKYQGEITHRCWPSRLHGIRTPVWLSLESTCFTEPPRVGPTARTWYFCFSHHPLWPPSTAHPLGGAARGLIQHLLMQWHVSPSSGPSWQ